MGLAEVRLRELEDLRLEAIYRTQIATELTALTGLLGLPVVPDKAGKIKQAYDRKVAEFMSIQEGALRRMTVFELKRQVGNG